MEKILETTELSNVPQIELVYTRGSHDGPREVIKNSEAAHRIFKALWNPGTIELVMEFKAMFLDAAGHVLAIYPVSSGGRTAAGIDARVIFAAALKLAAISVIFCTNYPSGNLEPGKGVLGLTEKLRDGGKFIDIKVLDLILITKEGYKSLTDEGLL
jgi:DNA repair protein RadC